jgi:hypothetical protein
VNETKVNDMKVNGMKENDLKAGDIEDMWMRSRKAQQLALPDLEF